MRQVAFFLIFMGFFLSGNAQGIFYGPIVINNEETQGNSVYTADLDNDGDLDVLSATGYDDKIAWYENDGNGNFGEQNVITTNAHWSRSVFASDLDGDGDMDVLSASGNDYKIAWYQNDGNGNFGEQIIIDSNLIGVNTVYAADLDGDGDTDVLSNNYGELLWYENDGNGNFGGQNVITDNVDKPRTIFTSDFDGDGDQDVLTACLSNYKIAWYENDGEGYFFYEHIIINSNGLHHVYASDMDNDGDIDIICPFFNDNKIEWYENDGNGNFESINLITSNNAGYVYSSDLDNDGDQDVISAGGYLIVWFKNDGNGNFGTQNIISTNAGDSQSVYASDLDGDGDFDILSAGWDDYNIAWYRNNTYTYSQPLDRELCLNDTAVFSIGITTNVLSYQWQILNGNNYENLSDVGHYSGTSTQTLSISNVTMDMNNKHYRCVLTYNNSQVETDDAVLTVFPLPETGNITGEPNPEPYKTYTYTVSNPNNSSFEWSIEGGIIINSTENSKDILWGDAGFGNLSVVEIDTNGCNGTPVQLAITIDVDELLAKYNIRVFPNPTSGKIRIEGDNIQKIEILSTGGKPMQSIVSKGEDIEINMSGEARGVYIIRFSLADKLVYSKLILK